MAGGDGEVEPLAGGNDLVVGGDRAGLHADDLTRIVNHRPAAVTRRDGRGVLQGGAERGQLAQGGNDTDRAGPLETERAADQQHGLALPGESGGALERGNAGDFGLEPDQGEVPVTVFGQQARDADEAAIAEADLGAVDAGEDVAASDDLVGGDEPAGAQAGQGLTGVIGNHGDDRWFDRRDKVGQVGSGRGRSQGPGAERQKQEPTSFH